TGVYQILLGWLTCFPRGCGPSSVGSETATIISCSPEPFISLVISKENGSYPPSCFPAELPFTNTSHCQSTAPKWSSNLPFRMAAGTLTVRLYHRRLSFPTFFPTPDNADSMGKGTSIFP